MKKNLLTFSALLLVFSLTTVSCKKKPKPIEQGTVTLTPTEKTIHYGETYQIIPSYSATGEAKKKSYKWSSSNTAVATVEPTITGGYGEVKGKRVGTAVISYKSTDGKFDKKSKVTVAARTNLLNGFYFDKGADEAKITSKQPREYDKNVEKSNENYLVYSSSDKKIPTLIYQLNGGKLQSLYVILTNTTEILKEAENYIVERFEPTGIGKYDVTFFKNSSNDMFPIGTVLGTFNKKNINGEDYAIGVMIMDSGRL